MKKLKNNTKTMLALIAKDQATRLRKRLDQGLAVDQQIKVPGRYKPMTLLEYASEKGAIRCAQLLVNSAAKLDKGYFKPLDLATLFGRLRIIKLLLASGANPSVRVSDPPHDSGSTPLMTAAATGNRAIFDALLTSGADPHATTARGASALSQAVAHRNQRAIERLVRAGCRASGQELHTQVYHGDVETVRLLIRAGADVNVETRGRYGLADLSPLDTAIQQRGAIVSYDRTNAGDRSRWTKELRKRHAKERRHYREIIEELVRAGAKLNHITVEESPLYRAAKGGDLEVVKLLLNTGADPNAAINVVPWKNLYRETALHAAARNGAVEIAKALIVAGADTRRNNSEGMRPLEAVIRQERSTEMEGTAWLQRTGVKVDKERVEVERAAWHNRRTQMIKLLSEYSNAEDATHAG